MSLAAIAAIITAVFAVASTGYQIYSTQQAQKFNDDVAETQRQTLELEADAAALRAQREADRRRRVARRQTARIQTAFEASGVIIDSGSAFDVALDQAIQGELHAQEALDQGNVTAWQRRAQASVTGANFGTQNQNVTTLLSGAGAVSGTLTRIPPKRPNTGEGGLTVGTT